MKFQPAIKWSGSKRSQSEEIINKIPNKKYDTYYEPFCGRCSVLFQLLNSDKKFNRYICSDLNGDLISLWKFIKDNPTKVINHYRNLWYELNKYDDKAYKRNFYNRIRDRFNKDKDPCDFMFIMRTTINGMPRYNKSGEFNNSFHITRNGINPDTLEKIILEWSSLLNKYNVEFINQSYLEINPNENDFIYLDPPYANTKGMYYGTIDYELLWNFLRNQKCDYILSFDGKTSSMDITYDVPKDIYNTHEYLYSGNSSFRRIIGKSNNEYVSESLYTKINIK